MHLPRMSISRLGSHTVANSGAFVRGKVAARRSTSDARDAYHHLDLANCAAALAAAGLALHPGLRLAHVPAAAPSRRCRVLFACTGNSAHSPVRSRFCGGGQIRTVRSGRSPRRAVRCRRGTRIDEHGDPCPCEVVQGLRRRDSRTTHAATTHLLSGPLTSRRLGSRAKFGATRLHGKRSAGCQAQLRIRSARSGSATAGQLLRV